ncbi:MAG: acyl-CoA ligase (AMP-forming), exosortase A system-associated [Piscinibacter sp.]|uniref:acyl-CoA ligase (AMP-forming), exosortase A system-associated n=1 Tax=Piscinibacter sp. TaxID=1903157 RepID=UPI00258A35DA|nr:acyl-CoA ligase (AMP-forming), exosortase A system-associated [Piscinibacter sp.]MCW5662466.1 acyl-CoA ligase (AMP-forming), exosortase A system-associated [Piscinibacter sp.]
MSHEATLLHELPLTSAARAPDAIALHDGPRRVSYAELADDVRRFASGLAALGARRGDRIAIFLDKRVETVVASFGAPAAGAVFVPINPLLKADQVGYILRDCAVRVLVTSADRLRSLAPALADCPDLHHVVVLGTPGTDIASPVPVHGWAALLDAPSKAGQRVIDNDVVGILYTSGSTGKPKGVVLSHRNMVAGAKSVASYLENRSDDVLLAALPLSFDAGFSQLTTAFHAGAGVVLLNYLLPKDVVKAIESHRVTGLTAVPPLWIQLTQVSWSDAARGALRYFANTGGRMPLETLKSLRALMPAASPFLMYGLTEAFRATYLPPSEVDRRPDSIGKAIPNSEILVLRPDGTSCEPGEPGELVQRGALVAQGYWNDPERTAERFKPLPGQLPGVILPEMAVFSGDTVRRDEEGFLYFIGRRDEMIKSSGYRISPNEVEEVLYATQMVGECAAFGLPHASLGEEVAVVVTPREGAELDVARLLAACRERLPAYMVPARVDTREGPLPRNANGKIDRKALAEAARAGLVAGAAR